MQLWLMIIVGIVALVAAFWIMRKIVNIFKGEDGKFSPAEFLKMVGAGTLLVLSVYMIVKEANREESWQLFGSTYIFLVIGGFLTIIGLEKVLLTAADIFKKDPPSVDRKKLNEDDYEEHEGR